MMKPWQDAIIKYESMNNQQNIADAIWDAYQLDLTELIPRANELKEEIRQGMIATVNAIINAVKSTLDKTPPELASDLMDRGIVLTGGGALLRGLDERLRHETGMPIHISERPLQAVAEGSGKCIEEFEALEKVLISEPRR